MSEQVEFKVGDIVEAFGLKGKITDIVEDAPNAYPIAVTYDDGDHVDSFTSDGRCMDWHATPSLKFISREEKKIPLAKNDLAKAWDEHLVGVTVSASDFSPSFKKILLCLGFKD